MTAHPREGAMLAALDKLGIAWTMQEHLPLYTVEESTAIHAAMPGLHTKNLFLKNRDGSFWLVTVPHDAGIDLKAAAPTLGSKKFSFAKPESLRALLGLEPGAVTPLGAFNDAQSAVRIVLDSAVAHAGTVNIHPLRNTATIAMTGRDLVLALTEWRHEPLVIDVPRRV